MTGTAAGGAVVSVRHLLHDAVHDLTHLDGNWGPYQHPGALLQFLKEES